MGGGNVATVFAVWSPILGDKHRDMRALLFMANTALDGDAPPRYFGGWEALACALGFDVEGNPDSAERNTKKALSALVKVGAITSSGTARAGVRAEYALNLVPGHTHVPSGSGRNVTWTQQQRSDGANQGDRQGYPGVTTRGTQRGTVRGTQQGDRQGSGSGTARGTPRRTQDPPRGAPEEEREEPVINSQRNPSTRGGAIAKGLLAGEKDDIEARYRRAHNHLMQLAPEHYMDLMNQAREQLGDNAPLRELVIHAATLTEAT